MKTMHVFPIKDGEPHFFHGTCCCNPRIDEDGFVIHNIIEEMSDQKWSSYEVDETTIAEFHFKDGGKMTQYIDVDGNLQEDFETEGD